MKLIITDRYPSMVLRRCARLLFKPAMALGGETLRRLRTPSYFHKCDMLHTMNFQSVQSCVTKLAKYHGYGFHKILGGRSQPSRVAEVRAAAGRLYPAT